MLSTKEEVFHYLEKISREFTLRELKFFTANHISESLNISRNLASQYLNELVKEQKAIKINSRPVYFFHKKNVERSAQVRLDSCVFSGLDEFQMKCRNGDRKRDFQKAVGHYLSLSTCIEQCKAAVQYPPNGLPVLLHGASGTGKSFLSRLMYEYGKNEGIIGKDKRYIAVDCKEYIQSDEQFVIGLCGEVDGKGWLSKANGGILFLDEIDSLSAAGQELIFSYLISGQYKGTGEDGETTVYESNARLVFATSRPPGEGLFKHLARRIPIVIPVPSLNERTVDEKEEMIVTFLKAEGRRMGVDVSISQTAFHCMLEYPFENNIDELKSCIANCCARAYLKKEQDGIVIRVYHLPDYMLPQLKLETEDRETQLIHMSSYSKDTSSDQIVQCYQSILECYQDYKENHISFEEALQEWQKEVNRYYDYLTYSHRLVNMRINTYEQLINQVFHMAGEMYRISFSKKQSYLMARCLYIQMKADHIIDNWLRQNQDEIESMYQELSQKLDREAIIGSRIQELIRQNLDMEISCFNACLLMLDIKSLNQGVKNPCAAGIILSHGYATASSIADAANQIIGKKVFDAIDMPLDVSPQDIAGVLEKHIRKFVVSRNVILLVDMGSLEEIYQDVNNLKNINIGIINNISTALAVDIGEGISANMEMEDILKRASENNVCTYRIFRNVQKEDAIIFSGENGIDTTEKLKELILKTSETAIPVRFVAYDYYRLMKNGSHDGIFNEYRVKCIIGVFNPEIEGIPFISLEDIISMNASEQLNAVFAEYLDEKQLEVFNQNLLKNFTLQNVVESITILNSARLLDEVEESVRRLQMLTGRKIEGRVITGLYVHLCCLVERLVTKTTLDNYQDLAEFEKKHADFIAEVRESFRNISGHYRVELPVSEIAYIYDYIDLNSKNKAIDMTDYEDE